MFVLLYYQLISCNSHMTSSMKFAKMAGIGLTTVLTAAHIHTRTGGFGYKTVDLRSDNPAPNSPIGSPDNIQYKFRDITKTKHVLYDKLEYSVDIYGPNGVTGSSHSIISCKPIRVVTD